MKVPHFAAFALLAAPVVLGAQAMPSCKTQPANLAEMHGCFRPLLVFSPSDADPRLKRQEAILDADADDMMDRFVLLVPIVPAARKTPTPLDSPYVVLSQQQMDTIRRRFRIAPAQFQVILLGEDSSAKLRSREPVSADRLNALIDTMPSRKLERLRPGAN
jgi:hypothetical protein